MASAVSESEMSDIDWLVMRARSFPKTNPYSAKAWLITAKSLFPQSFLIQFESYLVEKSAKNIIEAARHLQDMFITFPQEARLWEEIHSILDSLRKDPLDSNADFVTSMFGAIPTSIQCQMVLKVSETIPDILDRSRLLLMAMDKFPNLIQEHGLKLVELLVKEESNSGIVNSPVNCYRKLLVCDVMPLVLEKNGHLEVNKFHLCIWLQRAIEFYVTYLSQPANSSDSPSHSSTSSSPSPNKTGLSALNQEDMQVVDPWGSLFKLLVMIGDCLHWDMERDLVCKPREHQIQALNHYLVRAKSNSPTDTNNKQLLYTAIVLYVYSVLNYIGLVDPATCHTVGNQGSLILLNGFSNTVDDDIKPSSAKKSKLEPCRKSTLRTASSISAPAVIVNHFETAMLCVELLNSTDDMKFEFFNLCQNWQKETQMITNFFHIDMNIYQGNYDEALSLIQNPPSTTTNPDTNRKMSLQTACCHFSQKQYKKACEIVFDLIESVPVPSQTSTPNINSNTKETVDDMMGQVVLFKLSQHHLFVYCLQLLIAILKEKMLSSRSDTILAHLLILMQYTWPFHEDLFSQVITVIQKQKSFTYNLFFSYIHHVDFLEEFAFLDTQEGEKVNLDIMPISTKALAQQRTVTRGVNKGVKEDFKAALEKQVGMVFEPADVILRRFLKDEKGELLQSIP